MHPPRPPRAAQDLSWRDRLASLRNVRPLLRMVWETSPPLVVTTGFLRLVRALLPLAMLWVSKLILDAVVGRISHGSGQSDGTFGSWWRWNWAWPSPATCWAGQIPYATASWGTASRTG